MSEYPEREKPHRTYMPSDQVKNLVKISFTNNNQEYRHQNLIALAVVGSGGRGEETWMNGNSGW